MKDEEEPAYLKSDRVGRQESRRRPQYQGHVRRVRNFKSHLVRLAHELWWHEASDVKELESENTRLKAMYAELYLDNKVFMEVVEM